MRKYEAMFLFDPTFAADGANAETEIRRIMDRAGSEMILMGKWDERKLAYPIKKRKRGCYVLTYFNGEPGRIKEIERDCHLSEHVLRVLVTQAEDLSIERMEKIASDAPSAAKPPRATEASSGSAEAATKPTASPEPAASSEPAAGSEPAVASEAAVAVADKPKDSDQAAAPDAGDKKAE